MKDFNKTLPTIISKNGNHLLVDKSGVIGGQIKSVVTNEMIDKEEHNTYFERTAVITFQVNICKDLEDALKKYHE